MASIMRADLADALPFRVDYVDDGVQLQTFALRDVGVDALFDLSEPQTVYRVKLGDMCFVVRKRADGSISHLYFVPEYPNNDLGSKERLATYYALPVMGSASELCELRACDPSLRIIDWEAGVAMMARLKETATRSTRRTIDRVLEVDSLLKRHRPNLTSAEMRESVGPASGARLTVSSFLVGDVT